MARGSKHEEVHTEQFSRSWWAGVVAKNTSKTRCFEVEKSENQKNWKNKQENHFIPTCRKIMPRSENCSENTAKTLCFEVDQKKKHQKFKSP